MVAKRAANQSGTKIISAPALLRGGAFTACKDKPPSLSPARPHLPLSDPASCSAFDFPLKGVLQEAAKRTQVGSRGGVGHFCGRCQFQRCLVSPQTILGAPLPRHPRLHAAFQNTPCLPALKSVPSSSPPIHAAPRPATQPTHPQYWRLRDGAGKAPGLAGWWPEHAVTFVDNHVGPPFIIYASSFLISMVSFFVPGHFLNFLLAAPLVCVLRARGYCLRGGRALLLPRAVTPHPS